MSAIASRQAWQVSYRRGAFSEDTVLVRIVPHRRNMLCEAMVDAGRIGMSKFQSRLVGTIVLVALGLLCFPVCWTDRKSIIRMNLLAIPLGTEAPATAMSRYDVPAATQARWPTQPPEGAVMKRCGR